MSEHHIDGWFIYDFRGSNPVMWQVIGEKKSTTRRSFLMIPSSGNPKMLVHVVDKNLFAEVKFPIEYFTSWEEMIRKLKEMLKGYNKVAMEYSPNGSIPAVSLVDGGTIELIRSLGIEVCSSADLLQVAVAMWSENAFKSHLQVSKQVAEIKDMAFDYIKRTIKSGKSLTEYDVQKFILQEFQKRNLETEDRPIVAVNENSGNPHYEPSYKVCSRIKEGDWILIDLWARYPGESNVFSDITWVGYVGREVPSQYQTIFEIVKKARDLVIERLNEAFSKGETLEGWELDMVARNYIQRLGYGKYFIHRTGHSLSPGPSLHGLGVNLDNLETHDTRKVLPGIGFSIEPGIYLPEFGVRLEINVYISKNGPMITTPIQNEILKLA